MSLREGYPQHGQPGPRYRLSLSRGDGVRTVSLGPASVWAIAGLVLLTFAWSAAVTLYVAFHDDLMGALLARQAEMRAAYEDRLVEARARLDEAASQRLLERNSFKSKVNEVISRQARLEQRGAIVAALAAETETRNLSRLARRKAPTPNPQDALSAIQALGPDSGRRGKRRRRGARLRPSSRPQRSAARRQASPDRRAGGNLERPAFGRAFHDGKPARRRGQSRPGGAPWARRSRA